METPLRWMSLACLLVLALSACSSVDVARDYDPDADFRSLSTWDWLPAQADRSPDPQGGPLGLDDKRIRMAVRDIMTAKGFPKVEQEPSFYVTFRHKIEEEVDVDVFYDTFGYSYGGWWGGYGPIWGPRPVFNYTEEAVIVIDVVSAGSGQRELIWRGIASYPWDDDQEPLARVEQVRQAVAKVLETFPPSRME